MISRSEEIGMINPINADFDEARKLARVHTGRTHGVTNGKECERP